MAEIVINPKAPDDHWVSPSGSDCWCTVGQLKGLIAEVGRLTNEAVLRVAGADYDWDSQQDENKRLATEVERLTAEDDKLRGLVRTLQGNCLLLLERATNAEAEVAYFLDKLAPLGRDFDPVKERDAAYDLGHRDGIKKAAQVAYGVGMKHDAAGQEFDAAGAYEVMTAIESV